MGNFIEEIIEADLKAGRVKDIVVRFPPEPNGYLHIGHAKAMCLNFSLREKYNGKLNLRFDDTNPVKEDEEFVQSITEDVKWIGKPDKILYASDYFCKMVDCAIVLIKKGLAYVDDLTAEQIRETRGTLKTPGVESKSRNRSIEENLALFEDMKSGKVKEGELVLRAKIDMSSPNMNMRDPVIYRVLHTAHHRAGDKWCIYPMYDFAHPLEDAFEKISHSCCSLEFEDHRPLYDWFIEKCELVPAPHQYEFARLNIKNTILSKRFLKQLVDENYVNGWDDPRMPTLSGLRRRGYTAASIKDFCARTGVAKAHSEVDPAQLESCIREEYNETAERAMAVLDPIELVITNRDDKYSEKLSFEYPIKGENKIRKISFSNRLFIEREDFLEYPPPKFFRLFKDGLVRLKGAYIIKCTDFEKGNDGLITKVFAEIIEGTKSGEVTSDVKAKGVIHWVNAKDCIEFEARLYDNLLVDETEENRENFLDRLNPNSLVIKKAVGEPFLKKAKKGAAFQFLRLAYFVRDSKEDDLVFNRTVGLKDTQKAKV